MQEYLYQFENIKRVRKALDGKPAVAAATNANHNSESLPLIYKNSVI